MLDGLKNATGQIIMYKETIEKARIPVERIAAIGRYNSSVKNKT